MSMGSELLDGSKFKEHDKALYNSFYHGCSLWNAHMDASTYLLGYFGLVSILILHKGML